MKKNSINLFAPINTEMVANLTTLVKETLATGFNQTNNKVFTAADLWNIQRQSQRRTQRRFSF